MLALHSGAILATHSGVIGKVANFRPEQVANISPESVANFDRNRCPTWSGIRTKISAGGYTVPKTVEYQHGRGE